MLLAVDTSTNQIGLALYDGAQVLAESLWTGKSRHTVELAASAADLLKRTGLTTADLQALAVAAGPGSFTSLRVGISFIKGLALACSLQVLGVNTLEVTAAGQPLAPLPLVCLLPAGRGRLAAGWFSAPQGAQRWQAQGAARVVTAADLAASLESETIVCGDLTAAERAQIGKNPRARLVSPALSVRRPALLAELAWERWQAGSVDEAASLAPVYLHIADPIPDFPAANGASNMGGPA